ncbi:ABC transporter permease [Candidatus Wolfebacteria bacterium]|nr:ABC transporter permease [Candidatus Wolfebacteria bacterium]
MLLKYIFKTAGINILANKSRSILTVIGIVIGVTSIITILSIGGGVENLIVGEISSLGADIIWIEPGREPSGFSDFTSTIFSNTLKEKDIEALKRKENVPDLIDIAPALSVPGSVSYGGETYKPMIMGWSAKFFEDVFKIYPEEGISFDETAIRNKERVAVIGSKVKEELFGTEEALGKSIKIGNQRFKVIGVLPPKGQIFFFDVGEFVLIPYSTAMTYILGIDYYNEVWVRVKNVDLIPTTVEDIKRVLRERHNIIDSEKDDFYIMTQQNMIDQVENILDILTIAIGAIVAIALVVGGVGVMNIMLVSVTERTKEIGLRKSLGATKKDIIYQFLVEAIILTFLGGIIGIILGLILSYGATLIVSKLLGVDWAFQFPIFAIILGVLSSVLTGLVFGIYPAFQAAKKEPIEALRYE